jgi:hypothetical protein
MPAQNVPITSYQIEISGWDEAESFFVEKATLEWNEQAEKTVCLRNPIRPGAVLFLRLLDSISTDHPFPIAYQATTVSRIPSRELYRVTVEQLRPNPSRVSHSISPPEPQLQ